MEILTRTGNASEALAPHGGRDAIQLVVALCAAWCDSCREFHATLARIAEARPNMLFIWVDIEDDSSVCGDIDIENFPTLAIYCGERLLHYGVSLPQEGVVARLIDELSTRAETATALAADVPQAVLDLPLKLRRRVGG